jgi:ATP-dependent DNA ligase
LRAGCAWALALSAFAERLNKKAKLLYVVFDALFVGGKDIREKPLLERKKILKTFMPRDPLLRYSEHVAEFCAGHWR